MELVIPIEDLKKIEEKEGIKLKRIKREDIKFLEPPGWAEKTLESLVVEADDALAYRLFEKYRVKIIRK